MMWMYVITKAMYFPGTFLRAFWEHTFARLLHIDVLRSTPYLSSNYESGHIVTLKVESKKRFFAFCVLPGLLNFIIGMPMLLAGALPLGFLGVDIVDPMSGDFCPPFILYCVLFLLGSALLCSMAPRLEDAQQLWFTLYGADNHTKPLGKVFAFLPTAGLYTFAWLEKFGITAIASVILLVFWICT